MSSPRSILIRGAALGLLTAILVAGGFLAYVEWYGRTDRIWPGVQIGRIQAGGLIPAEATLRLSSGAPQQPEVPVGAAVAGTGVALDAAGPVGAPAKRPEAAAPVIQLRAAGRTWQLDRSVVGPIPDVQSAVAAASTIGRNGSVVERARSYVNGLVHGYYVPVPVHLREDLIQEHLASIAAEIAQKPVDAAYDFETDTLTPDVDGQELDAQASLEAVRRAVLLEQPAVDLVVRPVTATVQAKDLTGARQYQVARFTTPILAADPGRVHNITMAVRKISGVMLQPGQIFSFNDVVGPRDAEHGWAPAKEIYQGEFVLGYGGGICQVSSTLYNSVLLAGLEVKERYHHDRPLEYVRPGRDATVAWKVLDFRFRNSLSMPLLMGARVLPGKPALIEVTLHAPRPLDGPAIGLEEADVKYLPAPLVEEFDDTLPPGERKVVNEGHYGIDIKIYRVYGTDANKRRELVSHDIYQPKPGKVLVGVGNAPGSERLLNPGIE